MKKLIIKVAKLFSNSSAVVAAFDAVAFMGDHVELRNLEVNVSIPFESGIHTFIPIHHFVSAMESIDNPTFKDRVSKTEIGATTLKDRKVVTSHKVTISAGKQSIKVSGEDLDDFPKTFHNEKAKQIGHFSESVLPILIDSLLFQSNDYLRPAMLYTYVDGHIAATDAHRLMFVKLENPLKEGVFMHRKVIKLMDIFGGDWQVSKSDAYFHLTNELGVKITWRNPGFRFPDWKVVVPAVDEKTPSVTLIKKELLAAIKTGAKFGNRSTNQGLLQLGKKSTYNTADVDFEREYSTEITASAVHEIGIAFNSNFLKQF